MKAKPILESPAFRDHESKMTLLLSCIALCEGLAQKRKLNILVYLVSFLLKLISSIIHVALAIVSNFAILTAVPMLMTCCWCYPRGDESAIIWPYLLAHRSWEMSYDLIDDLVYFTNGTRATDAKIAQLASKLPFTSKINLLPSKYWGSERATRDTSLLVTFELANFAKIAHKVLFVSHKWMDGDPCITHNLIEGVNHYIAGTRFCCRRTIKYIWLDTACADVDFDVFEIARVVSLIPKMHFLHFTGPGDQHYKSSAWCFTEFLMTAKTNRFYSGHGEKILTGEFTITNRDDWACIYLSLLCSNKHPVQRMNQLVQYSSGAAQFLRVPRLIITASVETLRMLSASDDVEVARMASETLVTYLPALTTIIDGFENTTAKALHQLRINGNTLA